MLTPKPEPSDITSLRQRQMVKDQVQLNVDLLAKIIGNDERRAKLEKRPVEYSQEARAAWSAMVRSHNLLARTLEAALGNPAK